MDAHHRKNLEDFLKAIEVKLPAYKHAYFSYLALKNGEVYELRQGRLSLQGVPSPNPTKFFKTENVRAGIFKLSDVKLAPKNFIESFFSGTLQTPDGELHFPSEPGQSYSTFYSPYYYEGISTQRHQIQIIIDGARRQILQSISLDWELKASPTPFFNLQELCEEFTIGKIRDNCLSIEVNAFNVTAISTSTTIDGTEANLVIDLAMELEKERAAIGFRVYHQNRVVKRGTLSGSDIVWEIVGDVQQGKGKLNVPAGAALDCISIYDKAAQSHLWVFDPKVAQNPYRSVHQAFDNNLDVLRTLLNQTPGRNANSRDLEVGVSWLLWILGFNTTYISGMSRMTDAPDLIATSPQGNFLVIECTMGFLKEDSKLPHLVGRAEKIRQNLMLSGNQHLRILPVIATTKTREEVRADLEQAYKLGVLVLTRENLLELIDRTNFFPDPNQLYIRAEEGLQRRQKQLQFPDLFPEK